MVQLLLVFFLGEECLRLHCLPVLNYLSKLQNHFFHSYRYQEFFCFSEVRARGLLNLGNSV